MTSGFQSIGPISSTPKIGVRKRTSFKKYADENGELKKKIMESDLEGKRAKTDMFKEMKDYFQLKRQILSEQGVTQLPH